MSTSLPNFETNVVKPQNFSVSFPKIPNVVFHCRQVPLPTISIPTINIPTGPGLIEWNVPGTVQTFDPMTIMFSVDEDLSNYNEIFDWMYDIRTQEFDEDLHTSDASVILHTNKNIPNVEYIYKNCWPINMSELTFNVNDETAEVLATVIFTYTGLERNKSLYL